MSTVHILTPTTPPYVEDRLRYLLSDQVDAPLLRALFEGHASAVPMASRPKGPVDPQASPAWFNRLVAEMRQAFAAAKSQPWQKSGGLPELGLAHQLKLSGIPALKVPATTRAELDAAVGRVAPDPSQKALFELEAPSPQTLLAHAAGLSALLGSSVQVSGCWLFDAVLGCSTQIVMDFKAIVAGPRPADIKGAPLKTVIKTPGYSAYPGGHAATTRAALLVFAAVARLPAADEAHLLRIGDRIARNRERAGLHHELDTSAGWLLGEFIAKVLLEARQDAGSFPLWSGLCAKAAQEW